MEAKLVVKASDVTSDFIDGIIKVFSKDALLDITVDYTIPTQTPGANFTNGHSVPSNGAKRGRKPKASQAGITVQAPKKRGRKPKVSVDVLNN